MGRRRGRKAVPPTYTQYLFYSVLGESDPDTAGISFFTKEGENCIDIGDFKGYKANPNYTEIKIIFNEVFVYIDGLNLQELAVDLKRKRVEDVYNTRQEIDKKHEQKNFRYSLDTDYKKEERRLPIIPEEHYKAKKVEIETVEGSKGAYLKTWTDKIKVGEHVVWDAMTPHDKAIWDYVNKSGFFKMKYTLMNDEITKEIYEKIMKPIYYEKKFKDEYEEFKLEQHENVIINAITVENRE
jgi:hypothetical protein